jgi:hypothetical protein
LAKLVEIPPVAMIPHRSSNGAEDIVEYYSSVCETSTLKEGPVYIYVQAAVVGGNAIARRSGPKATVHVGCSPFARRK